MKITVLGSTGMAGHVIANYLDQQGHEVLRVTRLELDVESLKSVGSFLEKTDLGDFVVNCIGLLVKDSIDRPDRATVINSWFPRYLAQYLQDSQTKLVHLSTDCVFDGVKGFYTERDVPNETNAYGQSKSLGEVNNNKDVTFRMSIIGPEIKKNGSGLLQWMLNNTNAEIPGWSNAWWNGITTLQLAKCIDQYINDPKIAGIYHLVSNKNQINKYELLCLINSIYGLGKTVIDVLGPKYVNKILVDTRQEMDFQIPDYATQLTELKNFSGWVS